MKKCIVLSRCIKADKFSFTYRFHFKGVYSGQKIESIEVRAETSLGGGNIVENEDYLMEIGITKVEFGIIFGTLIRCKCMDNLA